MRTPPRLWARPAAVCAGPPGQCRKMARKKIREFDAKRLLKAHILRLFGVSLPLNVAQVRGAGVRWPGSRA